MKLINFYRKPISMFVMVTFTILLCFWANQSPATPAAEKSQAATLENSQGESAGFIEQEEPEHAYRKGKKFPWLIVALVAVAGGAALYFLVLKKKDYTLTVTVGEGVTGTPVAGTSTNDKGTAVAYSYSLQSGYDNLSVTLDGAVVAASGSVTMNANHTLAASATKTFVLTVSKGEHVDGTPASGSYNHASGANVTYSYTPAGGYSNLEVKIDGVAATNAGTITMNANHTLAANLQGANIEVNSTPAGAKIYLDRVDSGHVTPFTFNFPTAVTKVIIVRGLCGYKEYTRTESVSVGQTKTVNANLAAGIYEDFTIPASPCWLPYYQSLWTTNEGSYKCKGSAPIQWSPSLYNSSFSGDYTVTVKTKQAKGTEVRAHGIFLGTGTSMTSNNGYLFFISDIHYAIYRFANYNLITNNGTWVEIGLGTSSALKPGMNVWNTITIAKAGSNYAFYINNVHVHSFSDATFDPSYCVLMAGVFGLPLETHFAYVDLDSGSGAGSILGLPVRINPATDKESLSRNPAPGER